MQGTAIGQERYKDGARKQIFYNIYILSFTRALGLPSLVPIRRSAFARELGPRVAAVISISLLSNC